MSKHMASFNRESGGSFLPEDYLQKKADRRTGLISLALFLVVMFGVVAAFFVTNRQWSIVKTQQQAINAEYASEAQKIELLKELEAQKAEMLQKAEITTALIEKVPRSILLAELINRMPEQLTLTEVNLTSKRVNPNAGSSSSKTSTRKDRRSGNKSSGKADDQKEPPRPALTAPPEFEFDLEIMGLAGSDDDVADYHAALKNCGLLGDVDLVFSGEVIVNDLGMRKFLMLATIRRDADARHIDPLEVPRGTTLARTMRIQPRVSDSRIQSMGLMGRDSKLEQKDESAGDEGPSAVTGVETDGE